MTDSSPFPPATPPAPEALEHPQSTPETLISMLWSHRFWVLCSCLALLQVLLVLASSLSPSSICAFQAVKGNISVSKMQRDMEIGRGQICLPDNLPGSGRIYQQQCQDLLLWQKRGALIGQVKMKATFMKVQDKKWTFGLSTQAFSHYDKLICTISWVIIES